jgi:integrase
MTKQPVTPATLRRLAGIPGRHPVADAKGLYLKVLDPARRYWTYRFRRDGRETELSLGAYGVSDADMTLAHAIVEHAKTRATVLEGNDPREGKRHRRTLNLAKKDGTLTFDEAAQQCVARREHEWRSLGHHQQWVSTLASLSPAFRALPVDQIRVEDVYSELAPIWDRTPTTARRLRGRIEAALDFARKPDDTRPNPAIWTGWLKTQLGKPKINRDPETGDHAHHAAMHFRNVPTLMRRLNERSETAARALEFLVLTAKRSGEVRLMTWNEIDLEHEAGFPVWTIPAFRMKMFRPHREPLSDAALAILDRQARAANATIESLIEQAKEPDNRLYVFLGMKPRRPIAERMLRLNLKRAKGVGTVHGLRAAFRSWCKSVGIPFETAEETLAHVPGGKTVRAYDRDDRLELRAELMAAWARYCLSASDAPLPMLPSPETIET